MLYFHNTQVPSISLTYGSRHVEINCPLLHHDFVYADG